MRVRSMHIHTASGLRPGRLQGGHQAPQEQDRRELDQLSRQDRGPQREVRAGADVRDPHPQRAERDTHGGRRLCRVDSPAGEGAARGGL